MAINTNSNSYPEFEESLPAPSECAHPPEAREIALYHDGTDAVGFCNRCRGYV